ARRSCTLFPYTTLFRSADVAEQRDGELVAGGQLGRLHHLAGGVALDGRFGVFDGADDGGGQFNRDRATVVEHDLDGHAFFEVVQDRKSTRLNSSHVKIS